MFAYLRIRPTHKVKYRSMYKTSYRHLNEDEHFRET
jgi:hypothetical protein